MVKQKSVKIWYWITTILFALFMLFSGISEVLMVPSGIELFQTLGYPIYLLYIIGIAKILGVITILQTKFKTIKEWAYAGFTIDFVGASASWLFVWAGILPVIFPLVMLTLMFVSYFLWKKTKND